MQLQIIENRIYEIRELQVMLDFDLAEMYEVETRRLKEQVKRNIERFPEDFMFQLTKDEWKEVVAKCDNLSNRIKYSPATPFAFTQEGVAMLSGILRSPIAIQVNIGIMRAFVSVRKYMLQTNSSRSIEQRIRLLEEANEELLRDMNDLSEDTQKALDDVFHAFAQLTNEINVSKTKPPRNPVEFIAHSNSSKSENLK